MHYRKFMKKITAMVLAGAAAAMLTMPALAVTGSEPSASDTAAVEIMNVEEGVTVTAYQVVSATYDEKGNGLTGYTTADGVSIADIEAITADEAALIARSINAGTLSLTSEVLTYDDNDTTATSDDYYTADLTAGTWIVLVSGSDDTIYNVMVVSNYYTDANDKDSLTTGTVDADGDFVENGSVIYAKKTTTSIDKQITNSDVTDSAGDAVDTATDVNVGDTVEYQIDTQFPDYSGSYDDGATTFTITDTLSAGLTLDKSSLTVQVGGTDVDFSDSSVGTKSISTNADGVTTITITFASDYILDHTKEKVTVTYAAVVNDSAVMAEDANSNTAVLTYSNEPGTLTGGKIVPNTTTTEDTVYTYSFELDDEISKVTAGGTASAEGDNVTVTNALAGATFTLYTDADCTVVYTNGNTDGTYTTDSDGFIKFSGLDAGTYYLAETEAPDGYALNDTVYKIVIEASYNEDGTLAGYTVSITDTSDEDGEAKVSEYTMNYASGEVVQTASENPTAVVDITLSALPSTGGTGLYLILLVSAGAVAAAGIAAASKKNRAHHA